MRLAVKWKSPIRPIPHHMKRRLIPPGLAITALTFALYPALAGTASEVSWLLWSLLILAILFAFSAAIFWWMRHTMVAQTRGLTIFGCALIDFFTAIVLGDIFLVYLFGTSWWALRQGHQASFITKVLGRSGLISAGVFIMATGAAVAFEMYRAHGNIQVHQGQANVVDSEKRG